MSSQKEQEKIRVVFMGTPEFSLPGLSALINNPTFEIVGVYTRTDKPVGRKQIITPPPVKILAQKNNIPIFQPEKIKPEADKIKSLEPDLIVVIAYGKIIPQEILDIPTYGCINVHASLLPKYRGAACLNAPIINGDQETGVTIMQMEAGLDTGPILRQEKVSLTNKTILKEVHDQLAQLGAEILPQTLIDWVAGKITPQKQDDSQASYVSTLKKEDGRLDWSKTATELERRIRGLNPWPGTFTYDKNGKIIKILAAEIDLQIDKETEKTKKIGQISLKNNKLRVRCGQDYLVILKLQTEGGKALTAQEFISGHADFIGQILK